MLFVPVLHRWWGSCRQQIQANVQGPMKQNASPGTQSEAPTQRRKPGRGEHPRPENQDTQHMLEQPRGSFPDFCAFLLACLTDIMASPQDPHKLSGPVLRDTARLSQRYPPSLRAMGFLVSQHGQLGAIPPPPFLSGFPLEYKRSRGAIPPPPKKRGISAILARYPMKTRQMGAIPPLCDTISKGYCAIWGGISHWAAKHTNRNPP